ncbi:glycosyltransferase family 2 protein [Pollutibacter soli]|uniref:glycosyltransferase family 2 protein n=1 Tax=Pollutibacter soli TaxID=3034157 RepID=UPI003013A146
MRLSIIIVSYNVRHFLEQCLLSVQKAIQHIDAEVLVADNASTDGSREYLSERFNNIRFSWNEENTGFAKANNQLLNIARGEYILFLNPDTIVPEDCFKKCLAYFDANKTVGALGVQMIDGTGHFLRESRRSFPSPLISFFKLTGLASLFPKSPVFARYHMGHMNQQVVHETDVLSGAFMMIRKKVLDITGGFDEMFFMYGEDIDLSYRIQKAGFKNVYFADTTIIHFKGESTKKGSLNYVRLFYKAMSLFVKKHLKGVKAGFVLFFIRISIWIRAILTAIGNFIRNAGLPLIDAALILLSFWIAKYLWNRFVRPDISYSRHLLTIAFPFFSILFMIASYYTGLYDKPGKPGQLIKSTGIAAVIIISCYSLWPEQFRFSRGILLSGIVLSFLLLRICRSIFIQFGILDPPEKGKKLQTIVAGTEREYERILYLLKNSGRNERVFGRVPVIENSNNPSVDKKQLDILIKESSIREIIFCENGLSFKEIIGLISTLKGNLRFRISGSGSMSIVGSDSKDEAGEILSEESGYALSSPVNQRLKRLVDIASSILLIISFPIGIFFLRKPLKTFGNAWQVLIGKRTWVGYFTNTPGLPFLRKSIIAGNGMPVAIRGLQAVNVEQVDKLYARDYSVYNDITLILKNYRQLCG